MERRQRPRVIPHKELQAYIANCCVPNKVLDYSATGLSIQLNRDQHLAGRKCRVDLVVDGRLCACAVPGVVRWSNNEAVGISLVPKNGYQVEAAYHVESDVMFY